MRIGNRQLKHFFKQLYIFMAMLVIVEAYFAYFLEDSKYTALAQNHYGLLLVVFILFTILFRGRPSFAYNDSKPHVSLRLGWFFFMKKEKIFEIPRDAIRSYHLKGTFLYRWLLISFTEGGNTKRKRFQVNYLSNKSHTKLKKSLARILEENQITD
jgi:hypothetical protein